MGVGPSKISLIARIGGVGKLVSLIIILSIILTATTISIKAKDITPGLEYMGGRVLLVTNNLNEQSLKVIENQGIYEKTDSLLNNIWNFTKSFWDFIVSFFMIYIWIRALTWVFVNLIIMDNSKTTSGVILALIFFLAIQIVCCSIFKYPIMTPIDAFSNFFKSLPYIYTPIADATSKVKIN